MKREEILQVLPERLRRVTERSVQDWDVLREIHIRCGHGLVLSMKGKKFFPEQNGQVVSRKEFRETLEGISNYSLYAFEEEIRKGYLTIPGGHRIGVAGKAVTERGEVRTLRNISFLNIRVSHEIKGCAERLMPFLFGGNSFFSTLIVSPPGAGKTTLLRDIVRYLATGDRTKGAKNVSVVDERSEIAGCYMGIPQRDVGPHCDVLDACPKAEGIVMMLRSMAPEVIAVDEIGTEEDCTALRAALTSGCSLLATAHGSSLRHIRENPFLSRMMEEKMFGRIIVLRGGGQPGQVEAVYDGDGRVVAQ